MINSTAVFIPTISHLAVVSSSVQNRTLLYGMVEYRAEHCTCPHLHPQNPPLHHPLQVSLLQSATDATTGVVDLDALATGVSAQARATREALQTELKGLLQGSALRCGGACAVTAVTFD